MLMSKDKEIFMSSQLRMIMVSVDYIDLHSITLPYNRHHFRDSLIVTSKADEKDGRILDLAQDNSAELFVTDAFYDDGARFNKWKALEQGLDVFGRHGWICLIDADVLWPKNLELYDTSNGNLATNSINGNTPMILERGKLYSPLRRIFPFSEMNKQWIHVIPQPTNPFCQPDPIAPTELRCFPSEEQWSRYPIHRNVGEWAGYTQIFHASDPALLTPPPWHEINWKHAGGADSFFQARWKSENKIRPPFEVLHLGNAGENWMGRSSPYLNGGGTHPESEQRRKELADVWQRRAQLRRQGLDPFADERIG